MIKESSLHHYSSYLRCVCVWVCVYLQQEVHEADVGLHLVLQLVEDDEGGERKAGALWRNKHYLTWNKRQKSL